MRGGGGVAGACIAWGGQPIGAALGGILAEHLGVRDALLLATAGVAVSLLAGLATTLRTTSLLGSLIPVDPV